ncbi:hypothetical protein ACRAWF_18925 [Streptomyces sp. L7]
MLASVRTPSGSSPRWRASPTDDLDALITKVWKQPAFFLAHPEGIAAFGRECTRRGVPPATVRFCSARSSSPGAACRSSPRTRVPLENGRTKFILLRTVAESRQGVVGTLPARALRRAGHGAVGALHADRPRQRHRLLPDLPVLLALAVLTDDALARARRRRGRQVP